MHALLVGLQPGHRLDRHRPEVGVQVGQVADRADVRGLVQHCADRRVDPAAAGGGRLGGGAQQVVDQGGHHRGAGTGAFAGEQVERVVRLRNPVEGVVADQEPPRVELGDRFDRRGPGRGQPGVGRGDVAQDRLGFQAAQRGQRGLVEAAALVGRRLEGALQAAGDRGQPGPAQQPDRCFAAGGQPVQDIAQGGAAVRGGDEQLPDQPFGALGEVRVGPLVPGADGLGEVGDQVLRVGHVGDRRPAGSTTRSARRRRSAAGPSRTPARPGRAARR